MNDRQTWWDIGIERYGAWEAGVDLAYTIGVEMTDMPITPIPKLTKTYDKIMEQYCKIHKVSPATADDNTLRKGVFSDTFNIVFE